MREVKAARAVDVSYPFSVVIFVARNDGTRTELVVRMRGGSGRWSGGTLLSAATEFCLVTTTLVHA